MANAYIGMSGGADFSTDTWTFEMVDDYRVGAGRYAIMPEDDYLALAAKSIDDAYAGRLALMLECAILDPIGVFDEACTLLDAYKAEWDRINPPPPTFMGEPMPPERRAIFAEMKAKREGEK